MDAWERKRGGSNDVDGWSKGNVDDVEVSYGGE